MKVNLPHGYYFNVGENSIDAYYQDPTPNEKTGKPKQPALVGHYSDVERAIKRITQHHASKQDGEMDMREFLMRWRSIYDSFAGILKDHKVI